MKKYTLIVLAVIILCGVSYAIGKSHSTPVFSGVSQKDLDTEKQKRLKVMAEYFINEARLNEVAEVDLSLGTTEEWSQGYVIAANKLSVNTTIDEATDDITILMKQKLVERNEMCKK